MSLPEDNVETATGAENPQPPIRTASNAALLHEPSISAPDGDHVVDSTAEPPMHGSGAADIFVVASAEPTVARPATALPEPVPQDPLRSVSALNGAAHTNSQPELDVRFIPPTGTSSIFPEAASADDDEQRDPGAAGLNRQGSELIDAVPESADETEESLDTVEEQDTSAESGTSTEVPEPDMVLSKTGWEMNFDVSGIINRKNTTDPYITACKQLRIVPVNFILQRLQSSQLIMPHHGLGPNGAEALAKVLGNNNALLELDLRSNAIEEGGAALGRALQINRTLVSLNLTGNKLGFDASVDLADMLQFNGSLKTLILRDNKLGDKEAQLFAEGLRQNSSLEVLDFSYNAIGDLGAITLGAGVGGNDTLKELNLGWNCIRHKGITGFLNGIKVVKHDDLYRKKISNSSSSQDNGILNSLSLEASGVGDTGQSLASFIAKNSSLQALNLRRTRLSDASLLLIGRAIEQNYSLRELDLSDNTWSNAGALALFKGLMSSNSSMQKLLMRNIKLTKDIRPKIDELLMEKTDLQIIEMSEADEMIAEKEKRTGMGLKQLRNLHNDSEAVLVREE
ncbi:hypothetical protein PhCBS80983_g02103 [Powellomyces hirtus]|uniref:Uncharacterized protein n=1 Tax=Powellomyces hirtus TaxID=109895 RepID=A0A507E832_9FUNG|nr:hypothetical protein PhCBS80983_g02103 [Powellomyces hirtus]